MFLSQHRDTQATFYLLKSNNRVYRILKSIGYHNILFLLADQPALTLTSFTSTSLVLSVPYQGSNLTKGYKFQYKPKTGSSSWMEEYHNRNPDTDYYTINGLKSWTCYEVKVIPKHKDGDVGITSVLKVFCTAEGGKLRKI